MTTKLIKSDGYERLLSNIRKELSSLEALVKNSTIRTYHKVGGYVCEDILENKERAGYGKYLIKRLAQDLDINKTTLWRSVQFYRAYPIVERVRQLSWGHYLALLPIKDEEKRKQLEQQSVLNDWKPKELRERIKSFKQKQSKLKPEEIPQLEFTRGQLHAYKLIETKAGVDIDLGFKMRLDFEGEEGSAGEDIKAIKKENGEYSVSPIRKSFSNGAGKISIQEESLFTYIAKVEKVIDGDTIEAVIYCDFKMKIIQTLRFRGIDCPEIDTPEGQRAKKFVEDRLKGLEFIVVKTYKDRSDKYDRYLADIFYKRGETDPQKVADNGNFLNQELLDAGLAKKV